MSKSRAAVRGVVGLLAVLFAVPAGAQAAVFTVNRFDDPASMVPFPVGCAGVVADCSLRQAVGDANATAGANVINLPAGTYTLSIAPAGADDNTTGDLNLTSASGTTSIVGADPNTTIVQGGTSLATAADRVFNVSAGSSASISNLTVRFGQAQSAFGHSGGGILDSGTLTLANDTVTQNASAAAASVATGGGGVDVEGSAAILRRCRATPRDSIAAEACDWVWGPER